MLDRHKPDTKLDKSRDAHSLERPKGFLQVSTCELHRTLLIAVPPKNRCSLAPLPSSKKGERQGYTEEKREVRKLEDGCRLSGGTILGNRNLAAVKRSKPDRAGAGELTQELGHIL